MTRGFWYLMTGILFMFYCAYYSRAEAKVPRHRHSTSTSSSGGESCETSSVRQNVTLRGGIKAGYFHKLAQYVAMELCVKLCCQEKGCDVAFMIGKNCYGVKCFSEELCRVVPAKNVPRALMISKVDFRGEVYLQKFMPEKIKCFQTSVEKNVTLNGGLTAGNFTAVGNVETIDACAKLCCVRDNCDLALLVNDRCFMVSCHSEEQCSSTPITTSIFRTYIARVNRTKETGESQQTVQALTLTPGKSSKLMCKNGVVQFNQTLLGGYDAGKFKLLARLTNMSTCIRLCCGEKTCDVALMIETKCYGVACRTLKLCRTIPAKNSAMLAHLNPRISYITSRNEEVSAVTLRRHSEICKSNVISYDVMLRGGRHAGKYKTFGEVEGMGECIRICCMEKRCDAAFMVSGICFTVKCHSDEACEEVHAPGSGYKPMLSYVVREKPTNHHVRYRERTHVDRRLGKHHRVKGTRKNSKNEATSVDVPRIPSPNLPSVDDNHYCTNSEIMYNVTLRGGITAGKFRDRGALPNMQECLRICCIAKSCDLAFMLGRHCFSVSCKNQAVCEVVTARTSTYSPRVAYIYARSNIADRTFKPTNSSTIQKGQTRAKSLVLEVKKVENSPVGNKNHSLLTTNPKRHRKYKNTGWIFTKNHRNKSGSGHFKITSQMKNLSEKKIKLKNLSKNKYNQTPENFKDTVLLQAFTGTDDPKNSGNTNFPAEIYKNNADVSHRNSSPGASNLTLDHDISPILNAKGVGSGNIASKKMVVNIQISRKVFLPATHNVTTSLLPYSRSPNFKDFLGNTTLVQTPGYQTVSPQEMASETPEISFRNDLRENPCHRKTNQRNQSSKYVASLQEMISDTFPSSSIQDSKEKHFSGNISKKNRTENQIVSLSKIMKPALTVNNEKEKNERPKNQLVHMGEMVNEASDSVSNGDLIGKYVFEQDNHITLTQHNQTASLQGMINETMSSSSEDYVSQNNEDNRVDSRTGKGNSTDLMLLEAFSLQQKVKSSNRSKGDFRPELSVSNFVSPTSATQSKTMESKVDRTIVKSNRKNKTMKSIGPHTSMLTTSTKLKTIEGDTISYLKDRTNNLSRSLQPHGKDENILISNSSISRVETDKK